ncbi:hypothetical protein QJS04_geneDACA017886 [Acorus gramineus]|uniref:Uncharacterized protein n=1 Tax=Acorus gramineus TaxID=55184 RepID=A0AAV9ANN8_ACOGR|nr:hypothetical protein QJS04_geneDACA017886 [Acorus gramineus]
MSFYEDLEPFIYLTRLKEKAYNVSESLSAVMSTASCGDDRAGDECRDDAAALRLKAVAVAAILLAGVAGVAIPLVGRKRRFLTTDGNLFAAAKAFAAGVILATGFVHMLSDGQEAFSNPCLAGSTVISSFPFSGFVAMMAALATLVADFVGTQYYERKHEQDLASAASAAKAAAVATASVAADEVEEGMHIVGIHAHAASHRHSHPHAHGACEVRREHEEVEAAGPSSHVRHVVVSQILELGIVSHSVIIGLSLGVSQSPCTIRPLIAALSFHQFFEGFALGGCISQAQFKALPATLMACFFAITTPAGIGIGAGVASFYNANSPRSLIIEGVFDSISAGILIYMALVDLIAADFLSHRMSCNLRLQISSYLALFLGALSMSSLAIWA